MIAKVYRRKLRIFLKRIKLIFEKYLTVLETGQEVRIFSDRPSYISTNDEQSDIFNPTMF